MLCAQVRYLTITDNGTLRQPVLRALRPDVSPADAATAELYEIEG
jgi:bifunctional non-homologous end joining protein LigD